MRPDFFLHLLFSFIICLVASAMFGIRKGLLIAVIAGLSKELFDYIRNTDVDFIDFIGDGVGIILSVFILKIKTMRNKNINSFIPAIIWAIFLFSTCLTPSFGQGGFPKSDISSLTDKAYVVVHDSAGTTGVLVDNLTGGDGNGIYQGTDSLSQTITHVKMDYPGLSNYGEQVLYIGSFEDPANNGPWGQNDVGFYIDKWNDGSVGFMNNDNATTYSQVAAYGNSAFLHSKAKNANSFSRDIETRAIFNGKTDATNNHVSSFINYAGTETNDAEVGLFLHGKGHTEAAVGLAYQTNSGTFTPRLLAIIGTDSTRTSTSYSGADVGTNKYELDETPSFRVQSIWGSASGTPEQLGYDWLKIVAPVNDTTGNGIHFYDKYTFPNATPSAGDFLGDSDADGILEWTNPVSIPTNEIAFGNADSTGLTSQPTVIMGDGYTGAAIDFNSSTGNAMRFPIVSTANSNIGSYSSTIMLRRSAGTHDAPIDVGTGFSLGRFAFYGYTGGGYRYSGALLAAPDSVNSSQVLSDIIFDLNGSPAGINAFKFNWRGYATWSGYGAQDYSPSTLGETWNDYVLAPSTTGTILKIHRDSLGGSGDNFFSANFTDASTRTHTFADDNNLSLRTDGTGTITIGNTNDFTFFARDTNGYIGYNDGTGPLINFSESLIRTTVTTNQLDLQGRTTNRTSLRFWDNDETQFYGIQANNNVTTSYTEITPAAGPAGNGYVKTYDTNGTTQFVDPTTIGNSGTVTGTGTTGSMTKWTSSTAIGNSIASDDGNTITVDGGLAGSNDLLILTGGLLDSRMTIRSESGSGDAELVLENEADDNNTWVVRRSADGNFEVLNTATQPYTGSATMVLRASTETLNINTVRTNLTPTTAATASGLTPANGDLVYVSTTDGTFTSVGFWGYENGAWVKL